VAPTAVVQVGRETPVVLAASPAAPPPTIARAHSPSPGRPRSPEPFDDDHTHEEGTVEDTAASTKDHRHRRVLKHGPGQKLGVTLSTHPTLAGVYIVSDLVLDDACARNGVRVGDLISKVNGERMANVNQAVKRIDDIWSHEAADPTKDRLKLSLADRTRDVHIISRHPEALGLKLTSSTAAKYGVAVISVEPDSPAAAAGLEPGHVLFAVNGKLAQSETQVLKEMEHQRAAAGVASVLISGRKLTEANLHRQATTTGELPVQIVHGA